MTKFLKVSLDQYSKSINADFTDSSLTDELDAIKMPKRATRRSAGYDFFSPFSFSLEPNESIKIPTGIKVHLGIREFLMLVPRSGLGFKYQVCLANTVGIIDAR